MTGNDAGAARFAKDFGYLDKFLVAITEYAASQPGERGEQMQALLDGEIARWQQIHSLLVGDSKPASATSRESSAKEKASTDGAGGQSGRRFPPVTGLTVGSLLGDRRREQR